MRFTASLLILITLGFINESYSCTNLLITKKASKNNSNMISYSADAGGFMEPLRFHPAKDHPKGSLVDIYDWDSGKFLGKIAQVDHTYQVIGNMNEYQVSIGETTFGGRSELRDTNGIVDYGSLMYLALQRSKTAREAIRVMDHLMQTYGYYSSGESFSIADANEVWIMEVIGKGPDGKGAVWVAERIPDGYVAAHANQARIRKIKNDPEYFMHSPDVVDFAVKKGIYNPQKDGEFSFADIYAPLDPGALLFCEGRVWRFFSLVAPSLKISDDYWRAVKGAEPYPLYIKPDKLLDVSDVAAIMRDHFEGTPYDMTKGLAAGPFGCPYRWKGLTWRLEGDTASEYAWERPISTQQTAFWFVSQMRSDMPREIGGVFWYGVDDAASSVLMPLYSSITYPPAPYATGSISEFDWNSAWWVFNLVANKAYSKYSFIIKDINKVQKELETQFYDYQPVVEKSAIELYNENPDKAKAFLTQYSVSNAENVFNRWRNLFAEITVKYNDGYINDVTKDNGRSPKSSGYDQEFLKQVVKEKPGFYNVEWKEKNKKKK